MRRFLSIAILLAAGYLTLDETGILDRVGTGTTPSDSLLTQLYESETSDVQIAGSGEVVRVLADDVDGDRHQRFVLRVQSGQTLLVAHNIDLAPRVPNLEEGDRVDFFGEYEWNDRGGVIHWTHRDPRGVHEAGWLRHEGRTYQ